MTSTKQTKRVGRKTMTDLPVLITVAQPDVSYAMDNHDDGGWGEDEKTHEFSILRG